MTSDDSLRGLFLRNIRRAIEKAKASGATVFAVQRVRRELIELEIEALDLLLTLCEEMHAKLGNTEINRDAMLAKLHGIDAAIERGWPGLLDAMVDPVAALDLIASPSKLADWRRSQPRAFFGECPEVITETAFVVQNPAPGGGWRKLSKCIGDAKTDVLVFLDRQGAEIYVRSREDLLLAVFEVEVRPVATASEVGARGITLGSDGVAFIAPEGWHVHKDAEHHEPWAASNGDMTAIAPTPELLLRAIGMCSAECPVVHIQADGRLACECSEPGGQTHEFACPLRPTNAASYAYAVEVGQA